MNRIPFADWLKLAAVRFHIPPDRFWRLSLKEWLWLAAPTAGPALTRSELTEMLTQHPDHSHES